MQPDAPANNPETLSQYRVVVARCQNLYVRKVADYGTSWRILRLISITDQIYIKAWRIRQLQDGRVPQVEDSIESEFVGIVNYGIIGLIQCELGTKEEYDLESVKAEALYAEKATAVESLMLRKNSDYGEAWREMAQESLVDLILTKLLRIRQILANDGRVQVSEGIDANYADIVNYAVFALIKMAS